MSTVALSESYRAEALRRMLDARLTRLVLAADPALGAEVLQAVPAGEVWAILGVRVDFFASGTAANRIPALVFDDGTNDYHSVPVSGNATSGFTWRLFWGAGVGTGYVLNVHQVMPLPSPPFLLSAGHRIRTLTTSLQVDDNYGVPILFVQRFSASDLAQIAADVEDELRATFGLGAGIE